jgi:hypothetical protein
LNIGACRMFDVPVWGSLAMSSYEERLETVPSHPEQAESYPELLALWKALRTREDPDQSELAEWDRLVMALLTIDERGYYLDEKRLAGATVAAGKVNRLSGILLGRHNPPPGLTHRARPSPEVEAAPQGAAAEPQGTRAEQQDAAGEQGAGASQQHAAPELEGARRDTAAEPQVGPAEPQSAAAEQQGVPPEQSEDKQPARR